MLYFRVGLEARSLKLSQLFGVLMQVQVQLFEFIRRQYVGVPTQDARWHFYKPMSELTKGLLSSG